MNKNTMGQINKNNLPVLLTYGWVRSTYAALRTLNRKGITVYSADSIPVGMCQQSKYCRKAFLYTDPFVKNEKQFIRDINNIAGQIGPHILIPSHDETEILAKYSQNLSRDIVLPINDWESINKANNKDLTAKAAIDSGLSVPKIISYGSIEELKESLKDYNKQFVIKLRKGNSAKGVFYPNNINEIITMVKRLIDQYSLDYYRFPIVQERVIGEGWGVSCLYWHGSRIAYFTHKRLREKIDTGGTSTLRESHPNPTLENMAFKILDNLKWHGIAMVEFKYDPETDKGWFIEINPRMWGSIALAISAGVDFPYLLYICATGRPSLAKELFNMTLVKYPWKARWYLGDLIYIAGMNNKVRHINKIVKLLRPGNANIMDDVYLDDLGAFCGEAMNYSYRLWKSHSLNPIEEGSIG